MARALPIHKLTDPGAPLRASAPVVLVRLQEALDLSDAARDESQIEALHDLRIAVRRLRYTLEIFAPTLSGETSGVLKTLTQLQEILGTIHDIDILIPVLLKSREREAAREEKLRQRKREVPDSASIGLTPLIERRQAERARLYREFYALWDALPPDAFAARLAALVSGEETILNSPST